MGNPTHLVLLTGTSGAGKSVALRALEDTGYYCVDNLPPELIVQLVQTVQMSADRRRHHIAIAVDGRSAISLPLLPQILRGLLGAGVDVRLLFLDASDDALIRRFSETRRRHPLSDRNTSAPGDEHRALADAIFAERELLAPLRPLSAVIDTSLIRSAQLQSWIKTLVGAPSTGLTLVFESFAFKRGVPVDADYVFDVRVLPNPYYVPALRPLTGLDAPVSDWLEQHDDVIKMRDEVGAFLEEWLPAFVRDHRSYLTVAIGCTGGQHRSVYLVEQLSRRFAPGWVTLTRHREMDARAHPHD